MSAIGDFFRDLFDAARTVYRNHKKGILLVCLLGFGFFAVFSVVSYKVSESPWFCGACHNMSPYVDSWKVSSHKDVGCIECHYKPGFFNHLKGKMTDGQVSLVYFLTGKTPGKYHAEIPDVSCLQCHVREELADDKSYKGISFSHSNHLEELRRGKKLKCSTCHGQIVQGEHIKVDEKECFICHFKPDENGERHPILADCRTCHEEVLEQIDINGRIFHHQRYIEEGVDCQKCHVDIITGDGSMIENKCVECHNEPQFITDNYSAEALHLNHVTNHKVECWHCHREIKHEIVRNPTSHDFGKKCTECHQEKQHLGPRELYMGQGGIDVPDTPDVMYLANVDCASCHQKSPSAESSKFTIEFQDLSMGDACNSCHGAGYDSMLLHWKEILNNEQNETNSRVFETEKILFQKKTAEGSDGENYRSARRLLAEARHNLNFVILGRGHHNINYSLKLLRVARSKTEEAKKLLDPSYVQKSVELAEYTCATLCHTEMETRKVTLGTADYPHKTHIRDLGLDCTDCHSTRENHGETHLKLCKDCHHGDGEGEVKCTDCHQEVASLFEGKAAHRAAGEPSFKSDVVECVECHQQVEEGEDSTREQLVAACEDCHEEGYGSHLEEWEIRVSAAREGQMERIEELRNIVFKAGQAGANTIKARNLLVQIENNEEMIKDGRGLHNPDFAEKIGEANELMINEVEESLYWNNE